MASSSVRGPRVSSRARWGGFFDSATPVPSSRDPQPKIDQSLRVMQRGMGLPAPETTTARKGSFRAVGRESRVSPGRESLALRLIVPLRSLEEEVEQEVVESLPVLVALLVAVVAERVEDAASLGLAGPLAGPAARAAAWAGLDLGLVLRNARAHAEGDRHRRVALGDV